MRTRVGVVGVAMVVGCVAALGACSSFSDADADATPSEAGVGDEARESESGTDAGATRDADQDEDGSLVVVLDAGDTSGNLVTNGDFTKACAGWELTQNAIATPLANGYGTPGSCRVCVTNGDGSFYIAQKLTIDLFPGNSFYVTAWARKVSSTDGPMTLEPLFQTYDNTEAMLDEGRNAPAFMTTTFASLNGLFTVKQSNATKLGIFFQTDLDPGATACFDLDDVVLKKQ